MPSFLTFSGKRLKQRSSLSVYSKTLKIVDDTPQNAYELTGPILSGNAVTLPDSGTYDSNELQLKLNGIDLTYLLDYNYVGSGPARTQVSFTFTLSGTRANPDVLDFFINQELS